MKFAIPSHPVFRRLVASSLISQFGDGLFLLTSIVVVNSIAHNVTALSWMFILTMVPSIVLAPVTGAVLDRFPKGTVAMVSQLARAASLAFLAIALWTGVDSLVVIYAVIILNETLYYILTPTSDSLTRELLGEDEYVHGESFMQAAWQVGMLLASLIGGTLLAYFGATHTLLCAAAAYFVSSIMLRNLSRGHNAPAQVAAPATTSAGWLREISEGWRYIRSRRSLLYASLAASLSLPIMQALNILIAPFNESLLHGDALTLGIIDAAIGLGGIISAAICASLARRQHLAGTTLSALIALMLALAAFVSCRSIAPAIGAYAAIGTFVGMFKVLAKSIVYRNVDAAYAGRTMTSISMVSLLISIPVALLIGQVAEHSITEAYLALICFVAAPMLFVALSRRPDPSPAG